MKLNPRKLNLIKLDIESLTKDTFISLAFLLLPKKIIYFPNYSYFHKIRTLFISQSIFAYSKELYINNNLQIPKDNL